VLRQLRHGKVKCLLPECLGQYEEFKCYAFVLMLYCNRRLYAFESCVLYLILYHLSILHICAWILKGGGKSIVKEGIFCGWSDFPNKY